MSAIWKVTDRLTLGADLDRGTEERAPLSEDVRKDVAWRGGAAYARLALSDSFSLALRAEQFDDPDGWRTGVVQRLREITLTPEYHATPQLVLRGDLRLDRSDADVFEKNGGRTSERQATALFNALYVF